MSKFQHAVDKMHAIMERLLESPLRSRDNLRDIPKEGIYVFYDKKKPLYVGRSRDLRTRIQNHSRKSSGRFNATFAFLMAMRKATRDGIKPPRVEPGRKPTRKDREEDPLFAPLFDAAKERVAKMKVQVVEVNDPVEQALFEVYAADRLGTLGRYNTFDTH